MSHQRRYEKTLDFISQGINKRSIILDVGTRNPFSEILIRNGFQVKNTMGEDLDENPEILSSIEADVTIALEILEHLVNPLGVLRAIKTPRLFATVPLRLWFSKAYRSENNPWDRHFHEFEDWQFDWLLDKAGWEITRKEKWTFRVWKPGIRPLLRSITPRYYAIEAHRK